jgi:hypothetical protein
MKIINDGTYFTNTGRIRYRASWNKKLVLQVQYKSIDKEGESILLWRDAMLEDIDMGENT